MYVCMYVCVYVCMYLQELSMELASHRISGAQNTEVVFRILENLVC
jgi:hypothetical protein